MATKERELHFPELLTDSILLPIELRDKVSQILGSRKDTK